MPPHVAIAAHLAELPVLLAPMEDVSDAPFRRACRSVGARLCVTEFVHADHVISDSRFARRKLALAVDDRPTAIQVYGADPARLVAAARIAECAAPGFIDINCGCWVPRVAGRGAGAAWLRDPDSMIAMARELVRAVALPVTIKTRIGWGPESDMPIIDLARRLEDVGVAALTIHCRTAHMGHTGRADWSWARRAREVVAIPVIVNGDIRTGADVVRALAETGCAGAMIGRGAIDHPWVFREARQALAGEAVTGPSDAERRAFYADLACGNAEQRGEKQGVAMTRRHLGVLGPISGELRASVLAAGTVSAVCDVLGAVQKRTSTRSVSPLPQSVPGNART